MGKFLTVMLSVLTIAGPCYGQGDGRQLSREEAIEDIDHMVDFIRGTHPDMFAQCPEEEFMAKVAEVKQGLPEIMDNVQFFRHAGVIPHMLNDGHTVMRFPAGSFDPQADPVFPYFVRIDPADSSIWLSGSRILSVNGVPAAEICGTLARYTGGEGAAYRLRSRVEKQFPLLMTAVYPAAVYDMLLDDGTTRSAEAVPMAMWQHYPREENGDAANYSYTIREDISTCILDFRQFADWEQFAMLLEEMFTEMERKNICNLIVDIRYNGGGNSSLGDELMQYISPVPFNAFGDTTVRYGDWVRRAFPEWELPPADTIVCYRSSPSRLIPLRDNPLRFAGRGQVYILTSIYTFSSASKFAWGAQYFGAGKIVGEETGGRIVSFGDMLTESLPNSRIDVGCSWKKFYGYGATDENIHGVIPDYDVPAGQAMEFTVDNLIKITAGPGCAGRQF